MYEPSLLEIGTAIVVMIFWFARLEFMAKQNKKDLEVLWKKHDDLSSEIRGQLIEMNKTLFEIKGYMSSSRGHD
jgi:hypothetical protein